jgi:PPOX class probable F420-dependent enzyme
MTVTQAQLDFLAAHRQGVLATLKRDGRAQISNIVYGYDADSGQVRISVTADRAKTRNVTRDPRVSMHVGGSDFWSFLVVEGEAALTPVTTDPTDATAEALVALYRSLAGEHPDWDEYRAAMISERRQMLSFAVSHAYGKIPD